MLFWYFRPSLLFATFIHLPVYYTAFWSAFHLRVFCSLFLYRPYVKPPPLSLYTRIKYHGWFVRLRIDDEMFCAVCVIHIPLYICSEYKPYALRNEPFSNGRIWTYNFVWYKHTLSNDSMQRDSIIVEQSTLEYWNTRSISRIMSMISHYEPVFYVEYHLAVK